MFTDRQKTHITQVKLTIRDHIKKSIVHSKYSDAVPWEDVYLSGGAIASLFQGETPKDWDFYFRHEDAMNTFVSRLKTIDDEIADVAAHYAEFLGQEGKMITANSVTMRDKNSFITKVFGEPNQVKQSFDFLHCTVHYDVKQDLLYISPRQYEMCVNKKLFVNNSKLVTTHRIEKFKKRGYKSYD